MISPMPSMTSWRMSVEPVGRGDGVTAPLGDAGAGELRAELMVGWESRLNMDVTGGAPEKVVYDDWSGGRLGD
jgi:hypothetical protein